MVPGWVAILFFKRVKHWAVSTGIIAGVVASLVFYNAQPDFGGVNAGLVVVAINVALTFGLSYLGEPVFRKPMAAWHPERDALEHPDDETRDEGPLPAHGDGPLAAPGQLSEREARGG